MHMTLHARDVIRNIISTPLRKMLIKLFAYFHMRGVLCCLSQITSLSIFLFLFFINSLICIGSIKLICIHIMLSWNLVRYSFHVKMFDVKNKLANVGPRQKYRKVLKKTRKEEEHNRCGFEVIKQNLAI
uniref:Uncharacterized protein n=1 Tax=Oryza brachyantha TaxID=4533 RepID=J3MQS2_ORYBR